MVCDPGSHAFCIRRTNAKSRVIDTTMLYNIYEYLWDIYIYIYIYIYMSHVCFGIYVSFYNWESDVCHRVLKARIQFKEKCKIYGNGPVYIYTKKILKIILRLVAMKSMTITMLVTIILVIVELWMVRQIKGWITRVIGMTMIATVEKKWKQEKQIVQSHFS